MHIATSQGAAAQALQKLAVVFRPLVGWLLFLRFGHSWDTIKHLSILLLDNLANNTDRKFAYLSLNDRKRYLESLYY